MDNGDRLRRLVEKRGEVANRDVVAELGVSAATSHRLLQALTTAGVLERRGAGRSARYRLRAIRRRFRVAALEESRAWQEVLAQIARIRPLGEALGQSLRYAATEMINNAIDHSGGRWVEVRVDFAAAACDKRQGNSSQNGQRRSDSWSEHELAEHQRRTTRRQDSSTGFRLQQRCRKESNGNDPAEAQQAGFVVRQLVQAQRACGDNHHCQVIGILKNTKPPHAVDVNRLPFFAVPL